MYSSWRLTAMVFLKEENPNTHPFREGNVMVRKDYYMILGIPRTESFGGIRAAFRELAKRYHPERVGARGARFLQEILHAYHVLSDPDKRRLYDQGLSHAEGKPLSVGGAIITEAGGSTASTVLETIPRVRRFETVCPPFEQMLAQVLRNFSRSEAPPEEPARSFNVQVILSPEEAARGGEILINIPVFYPCAACGGSGQDWLFTCSFCQAQGMTEEEEIVRVQIPAMVRDYTLMEIPVRGLGLHSLYLRLYIRVAA
jgi:DnaJ-class molecular chaperone